ncbi:MAG TPA: sigma 54-interacting transcriptional regulator [Polyangiaceae bacterium]|nr:sigma 54-interacting transcriptional regulator [Polyangiaceae bacterium]
MAELMDRTLDAEASPQGAGATVRVEPHLVVALECDRPLALSSRHRLGAGGRAVIGRGASRTVRRGGDHRATDLELRIPDRWMSQTHARLDGAVGKWAITDAGSKNGMRVNGAPKASHVLEPGDLVELGHTLLLYEEALHGAGPDDVDHASVSAAAPGFATLVPSLAESFGKLERLAKAGVPILVLGETGTGKEVVARAIHALSERSGKFVGVNAGAIPSTLVESELFGSTKGAFSGSVSDRPGLVRSADRGTLFLDEIGELPLPAQAAFLRVLEERRVRPVGGTDAVPVDVRLVSATNRDVERLVREGKFRDDLFSRVAGFRVVLPPLRERRADLGLLIGALIERIAGADATKVTISVEAARTLFSYRFPLNVRELENWLRAALALSGSDPIRPEHLPDPVDLGEDDDASDVPPKELTPDQERHRAEIIGLLSKHQGNVSAVAREAGKARNQVQRWLRRYALDPNDYR